MIIMKMIVWIMFTASNVRKSHISPIIYLFLLKNYQKKLEGFLIHNADLSETTG